MVTKTCKRCNSQIPDNKNYCTHHYMEELHKYDKAMEEYKRDLAEWNQLSPAEKARLDSLAEIKEIKDYAIGFGFIVGLAIWFLIYKENGIDWKYGALITVSTTLISGFIKPLQIFLGKTARSLAMGFVYFVAAGILTWLLSFFVPQIKENVQPIIIALAVIAFFFSLYRESMSMHHASARPTEPSKPNP